MNGKWWLVLVVLLCMVPGAYATKPDRARRCEEQNPSARKCQAVPEGGSAAIYLLGAGITCLGAVFICSRASKPSLL